MCKVKVRLSLCLMRHDVSAYGEVDVYTHVFLISALVGGEWSASRLSRLTP
jgi:hypothetical protein